MINRKTPSTLTEVFEFSLNWLVTVHRVDNGQWRAEADGQVVDGTTRWKAIHLLFEKLLPAMQKGIASDNFQTDGDPPAVEALARDNSADAIKRGEAKAKA